MDMELKPRPFCGVVPDIQEEPDAWYDGDSAFYAMCMNDDCRMCVETETYLTREEVIDAWNTRAERMGTMDRDEYGYWVCSECGETLPAWVTKYPANYCPYCGAKVVEE